MIKNKFDSISKSVSIGNSEGTKSDTKRKLFSSKDFNIGMTLNDIYQMEIELLNFCNLRCPLCSRNNKEVKEFINSSKYISLDMELLKRNLPKFPNLKKVHLVGGICEPTLYKNFIPLVEWLKGQNYSIMISTNGNSMNPKSWKKLGDLLDEKDEVRFAIDGATQETYQKYRINGNLQKIINNYIAFSHSSCFKVLQIIKFKHNENIYNQEIEDLLKMCPNIDYVYKLATGSENIKLGLEYPKNTNMRVNLYKKIFDTASKKSFESLSKEIYCYSKLGFIYLNHMGNFIPCCDRYEEFLLTDKKLVNITDIDKTDDMDSLLNYLNEIYKDVPNTKNCIKHCHKFVQMLQEPDDVIRSTI